MNIQLDAEEQDILNSFERDEWVSVATTEKLSYYEEIAKNTLAKEVNVSVSNEDLQLLKQIALQKGLSYQNLISTVVHSYVEQHG